MSSILNYRNRQPKPFASYFPAGTSLLALDLISKMLQFHPDDRISVEHALDHPYLAEYHVQMPEPVCLNLFNFEFEKVNYDLSSEDVQQLMYQEMLLYRPNSVHFPSNEKDGMDLQGIVIAVTRYFYLFFQEVLMDFIFFTLFVICHVHA